MYELVTISFSHYCEKARWALDRAGVPYREAAFMPALHFPYVRWKLWGRSEGEADRASSRYSTPLLCRGGFRVSDSREIVRYVDEVYGDGSLFAPEEAETLDKEYAERLGPHTRRMVYFFCLARPRLLFDLADNTVGPTQAALYRLSFPFGSRMLSRGLGISEEGYRASLKRTRSVADQVAERLSDGRPFLCGDRFSVADLGFATMMAPAVFPSQYGVPLPPLEDLQEDAQVILREFRAHPAGQFALRMFQEHRPAPGLSTA
ncbi:MAG: glutathione S-transferase family protein [Myxococcota bacterium]